MYKYEDIKPKLFNNDGFSLVIEIRDNALKLIELSGCARLDKIISKSSGDTWLMLAAIDFLVENGDLIEVNVGAAASQHRVFTVSA